MLLMMLVQAALAQQTTAGATPDLNAQNYRPPIDSTRLMWTDDATTRADGYFGARLFLSYVNDPLIYEVAPTDGTSDPTVHTLVGNVLQVDPIAYVHFKRMRLGVDLPVLLAADGESVTTGSGIGDLALDLKGTILDPEYDTIGLALEGRLTAPTASVDAPLGLSGAGGEIEAIVDKRIGGWILAGNLGTRFQPTSELENITVDDQLLFRAGAGYAYSDDTGVSVDLSGLGTYGAMGVTGGFPLEAMLGGWQRFGDVVVRGGIGTGLSAGIGAPDFRAVLGIAWEPPGVRDSDKDGLLDPVDACPEEPEDLDGYKDDDGCPDPSTMLYIRWVDEDDMEVEAVQSTLGGDGGRWSGRGHIATEVHPGTYDLEAMAAGFDPIATAIEVPPGKTHEIREVLRPVQGRLVINVTGPGGKPIAAEYTLRGDFLPISDEPIRLRPGDYGVRVRAEGYRIERMPVTIVSGQDTVVEVSLKPTKVEVTKERIDLREKVFFDTGKATIKPESFEMLDEVAGVLKDHPEILLVSIEGHTDSRGSASSNRKLSDARANSVMTYLVEHGVEASRLSAVGYGEDRPVDKANNAAAWEKNRRVEILIVKRSD